MENRMLLRITSMVRRDPSTNSTSGASPGRARYTSAALIDASAPPCTPTPTVAAAIAAATVGVGVHGGAEASMSAADVYLARPGLAPLVELVEGSRRTMLVIRNNILFSIAYNVLGATLASVSYT